MAKLEYKQLAADLLYRAESLVLRWLPDGKHEGAEWVARNPMRGGEDKHPTSFRINLYTGVWKDFALQDASGSDLISLFAYLNGYDKQGDAGRFGGVAGGCASSGWIVCGEKGGRQTEMDTASARPDRPAVRLLEQATG